MKRTVIILLIALLLFPCSSFADAKDTYSQAQELLSQSKYTEAAKLFDSISTYEDSSKLAMYCKACSLCESGYYDMGIVAFDGLGDFKDSPMRITYYKARSIEDKAGETDWNGMEEAMAVYSTVPVFLDSFDRIVALTSRIESAKNTEYNAAMSLKEAKKYSEAIEKLTKILDYKDSFEQIQICVYDAAVVLMNEGKYGEAYDAFISLGSYKDSAAKAATIYEQAKVDKLKNAKAGDIVIFGVYEQDGFTNNGKEKIEWQVLAKEENRLLVISLYALDCKPYHEKQGTITWETCTLRKWLNNDFLQVAFSSTEQAMIPTIRVSADKNPDYKTKPGNATQDKVFLLSIPEVHKYFTSDSAMTAKPTAYVKQQGAYTNKDGFCWWWLRSPGPFQDYAALVHHGGGVYKNCDLTYYDKPVRPALWIELSPDSSDSTEVPSVSENNPNQTENVMVPTTFELTSSAAGFMSDVKVTISFDAYGVITEVVVDASGEAIGGTVAQNEEFLAQFIGQTLPLSEVDVVAGVTCTSKAVIEAVNSLAE